jgi:excisionase family DNA binding protein
MTTYPDVLTTKEATEYLRLTKPTLLKLIHEGRIRTTKAGRQYRFLKSELDKFLRGENEDLKVASR